MKGFLIFFLIFIILTAIMVSVKELSKMFKSESFLKTLKFALPTYTNDGKFFVKIEKENKTSTQIKNNISLNTKNVKVEVNKNKENEITIKKPTPPPGFKESDLSPSFEKVKIRSVIKSGINKIISLYVNYNLTSTINITGWKITSNNGVQIVIPQAINDYYPSRYPKDEDIVGSGKHVINIYNWQSPNGRSFRLNKCIGYLDDYYNYKFNPSLPCFYPKLYKKEEILSFSGRCQDYILSLGNCKSPTPYELNSFSNEPKCRYFLDRFSYDGCYNLLRNENDFLENEWRLWITGFWNFDERHDRILLLDKDNLLVDTYTY